MSSHDRNIKGDSSTLEGAQKLAATIQQYWLQRGVLINVEIKPCSNGVGAETRYEVRSNLKMALPR